VVLFHQFLQDNRGGHLHGHTGVVSFSMARRAFDEGGMIRNARFLRGPRNAVNIGDKRDHRFAAAVARHPSRGNTGNAALDSKAIFL
jgi:hypothetical protein